MAKTNSYQRALKKRSQVCKTGKGKAELSKLVTKYKKDAEAAGKKASDINKIANKLLNTCPASVSGTKKRKTTAKRKTTTKRK